MLGNAVIYYFFLVSLAFFFVGNALSGKFKMNTGHTQKVRLLYKTILKLHRGMPPELQIIGDNYVKDEFKRHKKCTPDEAEIFIKEWSVCI